MDKIKEAQDLAEKLLDECICQVGDDKGALKDEPESVKKSEEDIKKAVKMEEGAPIRGAALAKMRLGIERNDKNYKEGNDMDPKAKANAKKRVEESDQVKIAQQKDTLLDNNERIVKDKVDKEASLDPVPTVESDKMIDESMKDVYNRMTGKGVSYTATGSKKLNHKSKGVKKSKSMKGHQAQNRTKERIRSMKNSFKKAFKEQDEMQQEGWFKDTVNFSKDAVKSYKAGKTPKFIKKRRQGSDNPKDNRLMKALAQRKKTMAALKN